MDCHKLPISCYYPTGSILAHGPVVGIWKPFLSISSISVEYGGLKKKCILRLAKAKLKKEKKMTLPILPTPLCCSASNQHKAQLTTIKKDGGRVLKKGMHFLFLE